PCDCVSVDIVQNRRLEDKEAPIDPSLADLRLLGKLYHLVADEVHPAESSGRADSSDGRESAVRAVKRQQPSDIDVGDAVAVGHQKGFLKHLGKSLQAASGVRLQSGIHQVYQPIFGMAGAAGDLPFPGSYRQISVQVQAIDEVPLDQLALVTERNHE